MAHEILHVGLRHQLREEHRDPFLWNLATDFVINQWLIDMRIGHPPEFGFLLDQQFEGWSAEEVYDHICRYLSKYKRARTFRGQGLGDMVGNQSESWWQMGPGLDLDTYFRHALGQGLEYHEASGRGLLPRGLVEEIYAQWQPPIPWDVELAEWFDHHFAPVESQRSYRRMSRRQMATPDIPRPRTVPVEAWADGRTFGVVIDTSESMDRVLLAQALGAIASFAASRDVPAARVVFCDAHAYDAGYLSPDDVAGKVSVKGRGGTTLQPGIDLIERSEDFPENGPILVITDGLCENNVTVKRDHAFLIPRGRTLPFHPRGPIFRMSDPSP